MYLGSDQFDFDPEDANLMRMVREAELQNADVIAGAFKDEFGLWDQSCLHIDIRNYTLEVWSGYYKLGLVSSLASLLQKKII